ncbi:triple gene block protein 2 [Plantain virus X]|uniref:Triple gene block protein 2 n=1 Tax=Plantain virus X TaxID=1331744 RepID=A0A0S2ZXH8_9VIRU|nr:triple gene block protein 2 [Plantain virus X]ALQ43528.1 triple gene block protein 2 [Plantain virus X]
MPGLTPPTNFEQVWKIAAIGLLTCGSIYALRANHQPHVGDNLHALPHGGLYRDGTKQITYCSPQKTHAYNHKWTAAAAIAILSLLIYAQSRFSLGNRPDPVRVCRHCPQAGNDVHGHHHG